VPCLISSIEEDDVTVLENEEVGPSLGCGNVSMNFIVVLMDCDVLRGYPIE